MVAAEIEGYAVFLISSDILTDQRLDRRFLFVRETKKKVTREKWALRATIAIFGPRARHGIPSKIVDPYYCTYIYNSRRLFRPMRARQLNLSLYRLIRSHLRCSYFGLAQFVHTRHFYVRNMRKKRSYIIIIIPKTDQNSQLWELQRWRWKALGNPQLRIYTYMYASRRSRFIVRFRLYTSRRKNTCIYI